MKRTLMHILKELWIAVLLFTLNTGQTIFLFAQNGVKSVSSFVQGFIFTGAHASCHWARCRVQPGQIASLRAGI